jgi:hypothetical protein
MEKKLFVICKEMQGFRAIQAAAMIIDDRARFPPR